MRLCHALTLLGLAACVPADLSPPPRTAESPLAAVAEVRTLAFRALDGRQQTVAVCEVTGPGYRVEVTTPSGVELPLGPGGAPDATEIRCTRGGEVMVGGPIPADATMVFAVYNRNDAGIIYAN